MKLQPPILFINLKTYAEATGKAAAQLAKAAQSVTKATKHTIVLVAQPSDIRMLVGNCMLPVFAQHVDAIEYGQHTGSILPEAVREAGAVGTVLNHAERKLDNETLERAIERAETIGLATMACAESEQQSKEIASFSIKPSFIALEPPELIGGDVSVSTAKPKLITDCISTIKCIDESIQVIAGAGIKKKTDVRKALELGTVGVFVASGIVKAEDQRKAIEGLIQGFGDD